MDELEKRNYIVVGSKKAATSIECDADIEDNYSWLAQSGNCKRQKDFNLFDEFDEIEVLEQLLSKKLKIQQDAFSDDFQEEQPAIRFPTFSDINF